MNWLLRGVQPNTFTYSILMDVFCLMGKIHDWEKFFVSMASKGCMPNVVSYNILMDGYIQNKKVDQAMDL